MTKMPFKGFIFSSFLNRLKGYCWKNRYCSKAQPKISPVEGTNLIKSFCARGLLGPARQLFDEMPERDVVAWTAMLSGYTSNGRHEDAWAILRGMMAAGMTPNAFTLSSALKASKGLEWSGAAASVHGLAVRVGVDRCTYVENALLDAYAAACGADGASDARKVFEGIAERTAVSCTTMVAAYIRWGDGWAAMEVFMQMIKEGAELNPYTCSIGIRACTSIESLILGKQFHAATVKLGHDLDLPVANSLVDMYCRCMSLPEAKQFFNEMQERDLITWNAMIAGFERFGSHKAMQLFHEMVMQDIQPNCFTFTSIASACANLAILKCGQQVHGAIIRRGFKGNRQVCNALVDMYAKCGSLNKSEIIFRDMPWKSLVSWTSMIIGYGINGYGKEAVELFARMIDSGMQPDHIVFMGVISACSHAGLVEEGLVYFEMMSTEYNLLPSKEVYGCVIDLLGRAGRVTEAYELMTKMPYEPDESIWGALLGACKMHKNMELGKLAAQKMMELKPRGAKTYIILSNIYASGSEWREFADTRRLLRGVGGKKEAGRSWTEVRDKVYSFVIGDRSNPYVDLIYEALEMLAQHMTEAESDFLFEFDELLKTFEGVT